jgi:hypothetical protein
MAVSVPSYVDWIYGLLPKTKRSDTCSQPHPQFVILFVGKDEIPFGIQKDVLVAQSPFYREEFAKPEYKEKVELIVQLPNSSVETFGCVQNFIYTGNIYDTKAGVDIPDYPLLMDIWKLASELKIAPLRTSVLAVMAERRQLTQSIPGTDLLKQAWKETEEGSGLRKMLIEWAAEHSEFLILSWMIVSPIYLSLFNLSYTYTY